MRSFAILSYNTTLTVAARFMQYRVGTLTTLAAPLRDSLRNGTIFRAEELASHFGVTSPIAA